MEGNLIMKGNGAIARPVALAVLAGGLVITSGIVRFASAGEVTMPKPIASCMVQPIYPEQEKKEGIVGLVLLNVMVLASGKVGEITPKQEVAGHPAFTASASAALAKWCFEPGREGDKAVDVSVVIPVRFALEEKKE